ncbi:hypothetical protein SCLCIDRAFT_1217790 [Scleroderma citrinum Foug A]|uniref:Uncharacterized protein n=1 Tax=Scleroderma citrinum Foug A TaxID=1036808 RepID=A0A0C3DTA9_9AGAM|nr:hypothetical protein SCLCIDRAFT_1217790 [Scleroderma citrinum Foug A]
MLTEAGIDGSTHSYLGNVTFHSATDTHIVENYQHQRVSLARLMWTIRRPGSTLRVPPAGNKLHLKGSNRSEVQWQSAHLMLAFLAMQLNVVLDTCQTPQPQFKAPTACTKYLITSNTLQGRSGLATSGVFYR